MEKLDGNTFRKLLCGGARGIEDNISTINELNVFPVPDGDTGTNMSRTIASGVAKITPGEDVPLGTVARDFSKGSLFGARGNSGVILSQFFAGMCEALADKDSATPLELAAAFKCGVERAYKAVSNPVEGTILTVFRESAEYAESHLSEESTLEDFLKLTVEAAEQSLKRTKEILPVLSEADVVDSGGAGYLCIAKGMYESLRNGGEVTLSPSTETEAKEDTPNYDLFTADSALEYGYCTECLVRLMRAKTDAAAFDATAFAEELARKGCDSIVALKDGDILKVHAHTKAPSDVLTLCQQYGEFLQVKIENMSLQHSAKTATEAPKKPHRRYGIVTVATGEGLTALFTALGADVVIEGGQTANPSAEDFLAAFDALNADDILVFPNNKNILLAAGQAAELAKDRRVTVVPTKTMPQGYAALSVFNASVTDLDEQLSDITDAISSVCSAEITTAIRDTHVNGLAVCCGDRLAIVEGDIVATANTVEDAVFAAIDAVPDLDDRELITLFVGANVTDEARVALTEALEERFEELAVEVHIGGQDIYDYLIAVE